MSESVTLIKKARLTSRDPVKVFYLCVQAYVCVCVAVDVGADSSSLAGITFASPRASELTPATFQRAAETTPLILDADEALGQSRGKSDHV